MVFWELKCCPFCGCEEYYERRRATGIVRYYMRFDGKEANNSEMYGDLEYDCSGRVWCCDCDAYLGNIETDTVGVKAERAYKKQEVANGT